MFFNLKNAQDESKDPSKTNSKDTSPQPQQRFTQLKLNQEYEQFYRIFSEDNRMGPTITYFTEQTVDKEGDGGKKQTIVNKLIVSKLLQNDVDKQEEVGKEAGSKENGAASGVEDSKTPNRAATVDGQ